MTSDDRRDKPRPMDATDYIKRIYTSTNRLSWQPTSRQWSLDGEGIERAELIEEIRYDAPELGQGILGSALTRLKRELDGHAKMATADLAIGYGCKEGEADDSELRRWLLAVTGSEVDSRVHEANVWAMKQWLWQVLRNAQGLEVTWQMMPIIYSRTQATGKTRLIEKLTEPFKVRRRTLRSVNLQDQFYVSILGHTLIGILDEFAGSGDEEKLAAFKSLITADTLMARNAHRSDGIEMANRLSLIGSSNLLPPHGINDEGGSRRIWSIHGSEINIRYDAERKALAESVDPRKVWKAVDWRVGCLHDEVPEDVLRFMEHMRHSEWAPKGLVTGWYEHSTIEAQGQAIPMDAARDSLNYYADKHGFARFEGGKEALAIQLKALGATVPKTGRAYPIKNRRLTTWKDSDRPDLAVVSDK